MKFINLFRKNLRIAHLSENSELKVLQRSCHFDIIDIIESHLDKTISDSHDGLIMLHKGRSYRGQGKGMFFSYGERLCAIH